MFNYIWPLILVVISNTAYQICAKSVNNINPFASLGITYGVGAAASLILYFVTNKDGGGLIREFSKLNWAPFVLGLVIVGLEAGNIYAYRAGWQVSMLSIVQCSLLAVGLIFVGAFLFKESITWNKIVGIAVCLVGLVIINIKR